MRNKIKINAKRQVYKEQQLGQFQFFNRFSGAAEHRNHGVNRTIVKERKKQMAIATATATVGIEPKNERKASYLQIVL